ncbi:MAG: NAD(P)-binding protein [Myxococcales bacterium]|nr:NAD(P)-binding protein [Myxococcales bacterium]MCB9525078.1 NAD(P)-binding protein [Myxococcales bacterium]
MDTHDVSGGRPSGLPAHLAARILRPAPAPRSGALVVYWMRLAMRAHDNPALAVAQTAAATLGLPLLVYQGLDERGPYANDRHHTFILEGARDVAVELANAGVQYAFHLGRPGHRGPHLKTLAAQAALVVTDAAPVPFLRRWAAAVAQVAPLWMVDASCLVPLTASGEAPTRAFTFRDEHAALRRQALARDPFGPAPAPARSPAAPVPLPFAPLDLAGVDLAACVAECEIDHTVGPVPDTPGGTRAGRARWAAWRDRHLHAYHRKRNDAAVVSSTSRLSAYLHYGMLSPFEVAREANAAGHDGAQKFLDELLVWRELAWHWCHHTPDPEAFAALPDWAQDTLRAHAADPRAVRGWETLVRGRSGDPLWDLCQTSLLRHGELHNNVRMTWGKAIAGWTADPQAAIDTLVDLNHRFALDGRDPASYGGLLYSLGLFDRPFKPEAPVLGAVRTRSTTAHAERLDLGRLAARFERPRRHLPARVGVVGAGMAGLTCARTLHDHGLPVTVFDKGRGPGGRMATRRSDDAHFDHGAQYFTARDPHFLRFVQAWAADGHVAPWQGRFARWDKDRLVPDPPPTPRWVGVPRMSALTRHLARELDGRWGVQVRAVSRESGEWWLTDDAGGRHGPFDAVVVAIPAAQAAPLLGEAPALAAEAAAAKLIPNWTIMARFAAPLAFPFDGVRLGHDALGWIARQASKPGRPPTPAWVIQASPAWSATRLEADGAAVAEALLAAFRDLTGAPPPDRWIAHRWRYGFSGVQTGPAQRWDGDVRLGVCGDWLRQPRVQAAWQSGAALAGRMLADL